MKVFISWSGALSNEIATTLRDWLPSVLQALKPYVSSEDIYKGARWSAEVAGELNTSSFGIICLTPDNITAPWVNFEAGALSKSIDSARVSPFLFELKNSDVQGPLSQFQTTLFTEQDVRKLVSSLNSCLPDPLDDVRLRRNFDMWWPQLKSQLDGLKGKVKQPQVQPDEPPTDKDNVTTEILEELLFLTREQQRLLRDPMRLLPPEYIREIMRGSTGTNHRHPAYRDLDRGLRMLRESLSSDNISIEELREAVDRLDQPMSYILRPEREQLRRRERIIHEPAATTLRTE